MSNWHIGTEEKDFFVWVNPKTFSIKHQIGLVGSFTSVSPNLDNLFALPPFNGNNLMFIPNPSFNNGMISPFQNNLIRNYRVEYNLELARKSAFESYPPRLEALYLLETREDAQKYFDEHVSHVGNRILKRVKSVGSYTYSKHDSSWIDFCRLEHSMDADTIQYVSNAYWNGDSVENHQLMSMGSVWTKSPIMEILYMGKIDFYSKDLYKSD